MPIVNPLVQGGVAGGGGETSSPPPAASSPPPAYTPPPSTSRFAALGKGGFGSADNTSVHAGILIGVALIVVVGLKWSGFRFAVDAGVTKS
jgi:hypothetical protein